jgi:hypothetical protein
MTRPRAASAVASGFGVRRRRGKLGLTDGNWVGDVDGMDGMDGIIGKPNTPAVQNSVGCFEFIRRRSQTTATGTIPISLFIIMGPLWHGFEKSVSVRYGRFFGRKMGFGPCLNRCEYGG